MKNKWAALVAILILLVSVCAACTDTTKSQNTFVRLLYMFPESAKDFGAVCIIDYDRIWETNGISLKTPDYTVPREELYDLVKETTNGRPFIGGNALEFGSYYTGWTRYALLSPIQSETIGYDYTDVRAEINNIDLRPYLESIRPLEKFSDEPDWMIAALGTYDPEKTRAALSNTSAWPVLAIQNFNSTKYYGNVIYS